MSTTNTAARATAPEYGGRAPGIGTSAADRPIRVGFLVDSSAPWGVAPSARFRVLEYLPHFTDAGIEPVAFPSRPSKFIDDHWLLPWVERCLGRQCRDRLTGALHRWQLLTRAKDFRALKDCDVVVLQRDLQASPHSRLDEELLYFNDRIIFDFDEALYCRPSFCRTRPDEELWDEARHEKIARIVQMASHVVAATSVLAEYARGWHQRVTVIPTPVDTRHFVPPARPPANDPLVVGWMGTSDNLAYVRQILEPLERLALKHRFVLRVVCNDVPEAQKPRLRGGNSEFRVWSLRRELGELQQFDVGIMPLPDDEWTRGKAGFKLITYMACGVPCVASPVGYSPTVLGPAGQCGSYAVSANDWYDALDAMLADASLRRTLGRAGRARATALFDIRIHSRCWLEVIRKVANS